MVPINTAASVLNTGAWIEELLIQQSRVFAVDIAAYTVMSNHFHVVLHVNELRAKNWPNHEVIERWHSLYKGATYMDSHPKKNA